MHRKHGSMYSILRWNAVFDAPHSSWPRTRVAVIFNDFCSMSTCSYIPGTSSKDRQAYIRVLRIGPACGQFTVAHQRRQKKCDQVRDKGDGQEKMPRY